jgi:hypothetical protein
MIKKPIGNLDDKQKQHQVEKAFSYVQKAYTEARQNDIDFVVLLIPEKGRTLGGTSDKLFFFEGIVPLMHKAGIPYIDLRQPFANAGDPRDLYFTIDSHWNRNGIYVAAQEIMAFLRNSDNTRNQGASDD